MELGTIPLEAVQLLPKDILQFFVADRFCFEPFLISNQYPLRIEFVYDDNLDDYLASGSFSPLAISVFILCTESSLILDKIMALEGTPIIGTFNRDIAPWMQTYMAGRPHFIDHESLFRIFRNQAESFSQKLSLPPDRLSNLKVNDSALEFTQVNFKAADASFYIHNQLVGIIWDRHQVKIDTHEPADRGKILAMLARGVFRLHQEIAKEHQKKTELPSLICILPSQNKEFHDHLKRSSKLLKDFDLSIFSQDINYVSKIILPAGVLPDDSEIKRRSFMLSILTQKHSFLDCMGYLHATYKNSPVIRLPNIGNDFSYLTAQLTPENYVPQRLKQISKNLNLLGRRVAKKALPTAISEVIKDYPAQIVAISDFPVEWLSIDDVPLGFLRDVCRMPETIPNSLLANFIRMSLLEFRINEDILERTLIVHGAPNDPIMSKSPQLLSSLELIKNIKQAVCPNKQSFFKIVNEFKPEFLIIDTHGHADTANRTTYLQMGSDQLSGEDLRSYLKTAIPIVFMSACSTFPQYGHFNAIPQAFLEAGSVSVTGTFFPVNILSSTMLYIRLLNNLSMACKKPLHRNWLDFVSHAIRSSMISHSLERVQKFLVKKGFQNVNVINEEWIKLLTLLSQPFERRQVYANWHKHMMALFPPDIREKLVHRLHSSEISPEYQFYTHVGRPDLISFSSW